MKEGFMHNIQPHAMSLVSYSALFCSLDKQTNDHWMWPAEHFLFFDHRYFC